MLILAYFCKIRAQEKEKINWRCHKQHTPVSIQYVRNGIPWCVAVVHNDGMSVRTAPNNSATRKKKSRCASVCAFAVGATNRIAVINYYGAVLPIWSKPAVFIRRKKRMPSLIQCLFVCFLAIGRSYVIMGFGKRVYHRYTGDRQTVSRKLASQPASK